MRVNADYFFFNDTATTEIYTLSLHDALPIFPGFGFSTPLTHDSEMTFVKTADLRHTLMRDALGHERYAVGASEFGDRKSTRLNSSHANISYAVFCLKKKK